MEVLSVVAVQVKTIQDAIRNKKQRLYRHALPCHVVNISICHLELPTESI